MTSYTDLLPEIMPEVVGCPNPVAKRALKNALIEFCTKSQAYRLSNVLAVAIEGLSEVELDVPDETRLVKVISMDYKGDSLDPTSETLLDASFSDWRNQQEAPTAFIPRTGNRIDLFPKPKETGLYLTATLALAPTQTSTGIDDEFIEQYFEPVLAGALNRLMTMRGQPWANYDLGISYGYKFQEAITEAKRNGQGSNYNKKRVIRYGGY